MSSPWHRLHQAQYSVILGLDALGDLRAPPPNGASRQHDIEIHILDAGDDTWTVGMALDYGSVVLPRMMLLGRRVAAPLADVQAAADAALAAFAAGGQPWLDAFWQALGSADAPPPTDALAALPRWTGDLDAPTTHPAPGPRAWSLHPGDDPRTVAVTQVGEGAVVSLHDPRTGARLVAHFGGHPRKPDQDALALTVRPLIVPEDGLVQLTATLACNTTSATHALDEAEAMLLAIHPAVNIRRAGYPGPRFYVDGAGVVWGSPEPRVGRAPPRGPADDWLSRRR